jgi:hypothetical protein
MRVSFGQAKLRTEFWNERCGFVAFLNIFKIDRTQSRKKHAKNSEGGPACGRVAFPFRRRRGPRSEVIGGAIAAEEASVIAQSRETAPPDGRAVFQLPRGQGR